MQAEGGLAKLNESRPAGQTGCSADKGVSLSSIGAGSLKVRAANRLFSPGTWQTMSGTRRYGSDVQNVLIHHWRVRTLRAQRGHAKLRAKRKKTVIRWAFYPDTQAASAKTGQNLPWSPKCQRVTGVIERSLHSLCLAAGLGLVELRPLTFHAAGYESGTDAEPRLAAPNQVKRNGWGRMVARLLGWFAT